MLLLACKNKEEQKKIIKGDSINIIEAIDSLPSHDLDSNKMLNSVKPFYYIENEIEDTTLIFSINGLSTEGSEVKAHFINDTLKYAVWNIYGEAGQVIIHYDFLNGDTIKVEEKEFDYDRNIGSVKSEKDMKLKTKLEYKLNKAGLIISELKEKDFINVFQEFKRTVPFVLTKKSK